MKYGSDGRTTPLPEELPTTCWHKETAKAT